MKVYIVGTGMDGRNTLTNEAEKAVAESGLLIGAERMLRPFSSSGKELFASYKPADIAEKLSISSHSTAAVLMSGDCGFFSGTKKLIPLLADFDVSVIPGISSVSYFCSKAGLSYERMKFISLHGQHSNIAVNVRTNEYCFFLLGGDMTAADVCRRLCGFGMGGVNVYIGKDLGYPGERIITGKASALTDAEADGLAVMVTENNEYLRHIPSAIDDGKFIRGNIPMTKSEVRCIAVAKLDTGSDSVVWDIGCGTGSVSVEAAFRCPDGKVFSFDKNSEAIMLTNENALEFGCDNIEASEGMCPDILADIPAPDKVFIGGSSGNLAGIFGIVHSKNPRADIVMTSVSLETLHDAISCFESYGTSPEIVQLSSARTKKLGSHTMLQAQNPVFIISGRTE